MDPNTPKCALCGNQLNPEDSFCTACGAAVPKASDTPPAVEATPPAAPAGPVPTPPAAAQAPIAPPPQPPQSSAPAAPVASAPVAPPPAGPAPGASASAPGMAFGTQPPPADAPPPLTEKLPPQPQQTPAPAAQGFAAPPPTQAPPASAPVGQAGPSPYGAAPGQAPQQPQPGVQPPQQPGQPTQPPVQPQPGQAAPPPAQQGYGAPPTQAGGYGAPPPQNPQSGYGAAPGGGYSPYGGGNTMTPSSPPPKKRNNALIAIIVIVAIVVVAGGVALFMLYGPPAEARRQSAIQEEYQTLVDTICNSSTPKAVAGQRSKLDSFDSANPGVVDADLDELVEACENYEYGNHSDADTFLSMISALEDLEDSNVDKIADCASELLPGVNSDYESYLATAEPPEEPEGGEGEGDGDGIEPPPANSGDPFADPYPFTNMDDLCTILEDDYYYFEFVNTSGKTITNLECWIFCYDENGNPMDGVAISSGLPNVEWEVDSQTIKDGQVYSPEDFGYFKFYRCSGTVYALPFVNYVEFSDGTSWGITNYDSEDNFVADNSEVLEYMEIMKMIADEYIKTSVAA